MHYIIVGDRANEYAIDLANKSCRYRIYDINNERSIHAIRTNVKTFTSERTYKCKLAIMLDADTLQEESQSALRRIMEIHAKHVSFVFCCQTLDAISDAIKSRCILIRFPRETVPDTHEEYPLDSLYSAIENNEIFNTYHTINELTKKGYRGDIILKHLVERYDGIASSCGIADRALLDGSNDALQIFNVLCTLFKYNPEMRTLNSTPSITLLSKRLTRSRDTLE